MLESLKKDEVFTYTKLSPEEMASRGILGRLVGPCAEFTIPTRNGRQYNEALWDKVFEDEIVNEKISNKCLFGELGHPIDREEVDPEKIAIALNEQPKKNDKGQLIACFDILNTPSGKILKTLCDYGTTIGISSRGSGDLTTDANGNEIVDPDTYYFECFDAVILPAVKSARLEYMHESLDQKAAKLRKALLESYNNASEEDKKVMKETLESLDIDLDEKEEKEEDKEFDSLKEAFSNDEFKKFMELAPKCGINSIRELADFMKKHNISEKEILPTLEKCAKGECEICKEELKEDFWDATFEIELDPRELDNKEKDKEELNITKPTVALTEDDEDIEDDKAVDEEKFDDSELAMSDEDVEKVNEPFEGEDGPEEAEEDLEDVETITVGDIAQQLADFDQEEPVEFAPIIIDDKEYQINALNWNEDEDGKIILNVDYNLPVEGDNIDNIEDVVDAEDAKNEEAVTEDENVESDVEDNEDEEMIEAFKNAIRLKDLLEEENKSLKIKQAVRDTEVSKLTEELSRYKAAFARTSEIAATAKKSENEIKTLKEQLLQKDAEIKSLNKSHTVKLAESADKNATHIKALTEKLNSTQNELDETSKKLVEQANIYKQEISKRTDIAKKYRAKYNAVLESYINFRASMLGVRPAEITNKLNENCTVEDIDDVCNKLLTETVNIPRLNFGKNSKVVVNEQKNAQEEDDLKDLYELAGLK